ncbi:hypothetical protein DEO72_LG7g2445 [Vigna unguiculata]|uniref:Uncharacterized protein n=1 Tax=Vigna unguiculata TaxID=3917 RepID=A0A4D6MKM2_VIGUN|nr:hypothetical protein DEO72_LG7g2445 [Vigna unguiculata]
MCIILSLFSAAVFAGTDMVDGHHRRLLQDHPHIKKADIIIYGIIAGLFLATVVFFIFIYFRYRRLLTE